MGNACLIFIAVFWATTPSPVRGEYYIWTDESGNTVISNDASQVPDQSTGTHVTIRSYEDTPSAPSSSLSSQATIGDQVQNLSSLPAHVPNLAYPQILLDTPDSSVLNDYTWVPLLQPVYLGSTAINGFWCLNSVGSPLHAFQLYLKGQGWRMPSGGWPRSSFSLGSRHQHRRLWSPPGARSGNLVYDQVLGEIRGMQAQTGAQITGGNTVYNQVLQELSLPHAPSHSGQGRAPCCSSEHHAQGQARAR